LSTGLFLTVCCTLIFILFIYAWEKFIQEQRQITSEADDIWPNLPTKITAFDPLANNGMVHDAFSAESSSTNSAWHQEECQKKTDENHLLQTNLQQTLQEFENYRLIAEEKLSHLQLQLEEMQTSALEQKNEIQRREENIQQLDAKIHDLSYEIKTLLYLHDNEKIDSDKNPMPTVIAENDFLLNNHTQSVSEPTSKGLFDRDLLEKKTAEQVPETIYSLTHPVSSTAEALHLLKKCIDVSQKLMGANGYGVESARYQAFPSYYHAIDQRRLFDVLRDETGALIILYSQQEQKLLFANQQVKTILGWSQEKFISDFALLLEDSHLEWQKALHELNTLPDTRIRILIKGKHGQEILLNCHLGNISRGLFRKHIIGVLYPA